MTEENNNPLDNNDPQPTDSGDSQDLKLEDVVEVAPDKISEEQKTFLEENKADLSDEQAEKFGLKKEEEEEEINIDDVKPETRTKVKKQPKKEEEEETDPEDKKVIGGIVKQQLKEAGVGEAKDQIEVDSFIRDNPEYSKYRAAALKYMKNSSYNNIPAHNIMAIVASRDQQKIGAKKEREAAEQAKSTQGGGTTIRKADGGKTDWHKATPEQVEAQKAKVLGHRM